MDLQALFSTEWRLWEALCDFVNTDDYTVYKSTLFPGFYGANGVHIKRGGGRSLAEWEQVFDSYFEKPRYRHKTFTCMKSDELMPLAEEARAADYDKVEIFSYMTASPKTLEGIDTERFRRVETEDDWRRYHALYHEDGKDASWYTPGGCDRLFEKMRYVTNAIDIHWLYLPDDSDELMGAVMGVFLHNGIARLQDVMTHPACRRRGFASALLRYVMGYAGEHLRADSIALCADTEYFAIDFYRKAGFVPVGEALELMKYAPK